jgi:hypothetical protein
MPTRNEEIVDLKKKEEKEERHYPTIYKPGSFDPENHFYEKSINSQCNSGKLFFHLSCSKLFKFRK